MLFYFKEKHGCSGFTKDVIENNKMVYQKMNLQIQRKQVMLDRQKLQLKQKSLQKKQPTASSDTITSEGVEAKKN